MPVRINGWKRRKEKRKHNLMTNLLISFHSEKLHALLLHIDEKTPQLAKACQHHATLRTKPMPRSRHEEIQDQC